jgi:hypothetical protein
MNKVYKILLLSFAVLLFTGAVMFFYRTIVAPPKELTFSNQYITDVNRDISGLSKSLNDFSLDSLYTVITEETDFMWKDSAFSYRDKDLLVAQFIKKYIPLYVEKCDNKFNKSEWNEAELQRIKAHITELRNITTTGKVTIIDGTDLESINRVSNVIVSYYEAKNAANAGGYSGLESAKKKIANARKYAKMSPLNNCHQLVSNLNSVASRLEQAHYSYLSGQVERLRNWQNYTVDSYDNLAMDIAEKLKEYKNNAKSVYGSTSNVSALEERASHYYNASNFN